MAGSSLIVRFNHLPALRRSLPEQIYAVGERHAKRIVEKAAQYSLPRYDTGLMSRSFKYNRSGSEWSIYNDATSPEGYPYPTAQELGFTTPSGTHVPGLPMIIRAFDEEVNSWVSDLRGLPRLP